MDRSIFLAIAQLLKRRAQELASAMPHLTTVEAVQRTHRLVASSTALRALLTAYGHAVEEPAPKFSDLAAAQNASPSGIVRRYNIDTAEALRHYDSTPRALQQLLDTVPSITAPELVGFDSDLNTLLFELGVVPEHLEAAMQVLSPITLDDILDSDGVEINTAPHRAAIDDLNSSNARTLGHVMHALRSLLSRADWSDQWISGPTSGVIVEWRNGPSIGEALALLCPVLVNETPTTGIQGLRLDEQTKHFGLLTYETDPPTTVQLRRWA